MADDKDIDFGDDVDVPTFEQILEMDEDDDDREFSKSLVFGFFDQADTTFEKMDTALDEEDLAELSSLGHFLKGSSATLGFTKVKDECEKIQNYGRMKDKTGEHDEPDKKKCLVLIGESVAECKMYYARVFSLMRQYYGEL